MIRPKLVVYDWDGVIAHTVPEIHRAVCAVCERLGGRTPTFEEYCRDYRAPWLPFYRSLGVSASEEEIAQEYFAILFDTECPFHEGAFDVVEQLASRGVTLAIVSADRRNRIRPALERLGVTAFDGRVIEGMLHKTEALRALRVASGASPQEAAFIGDMVSDVLHGNEAGLTTVGFAGIPAMKEVLLAHGARYCVESHAELPGLFGIAPR